ncbi:MAG: serine/threonine-protein kinase [Verrucomicrobiota bacterium]
MTQELAQCTVCESIMDVSAAAPFNRVVCPDCSAEVRVKCHFGNYQLERRLAYGGMSVVFVARDQTLDREVALKVLNDDYCDDATRTAQFEKEAELTALVSHPNVVRVYSVGRAYGRFYIAMELLSGESLEARLEKGEPLEETEALRIAIQVVEGLQAAHLSGLIHRDIKPGNILVEQSGNTKLVDFGLSLVTQGGMAQAEEIFATPFYASPEGLEGQVEDFRSDMYAFGASFYHILSGKPPIETKSTSTRVLLEAKRESRSLLDAAADVSGPTAAVISRAMAYEPGNRYRDYEDLLSALRAAKVGQYFREGDSVESRAGEARKVKKSRCVIAGVVGIAVVGGGLWLFLSRPSTEVELVEPAGVSLEGDSSVEDAALLVGRSYQEARDALVARRFSKAELLFSQLWRGEGVPEPTASWACFEAGLAAALDGRGGDARAHFGRLEEHLEEAEVESVLRDEMSEIARKWQRFPFFQRREGGIEGSEHLLFAFARALKNWEQGDLEEGEMFEEVAQIGVTPQLESVQVYRDLAKLYVGDAKLLATESPRLGSQSPAVDVQAELERLRELSGRLQTLGRAPFTVDVWRKRLGLRRNPEELPSWKNGGERMIKE